MSYSFESDRARTLNENALAGFELFAQNRCRFVCVTGPVAFDRCPGPFQIVSAELVCPPQFE